MEEIKDLHMLNLEWGCITNLMDRICAIEDKIDGGWPELVEMVADAATEEGEAKTDPATLFFNLYQYLWRLYYRLKANPERRPFNIVKKSARADNGNSAYADEGYIVYNYDYATFKWLKEIGCGLYITNDWGKVPVDKLNDKQRRAFARRAGE